VFADVMVQGGLVGYTVQFVGAWGLAARTTWCSGALLRIKKRIETVVSSILWVNVALMILVDVVDNGELQYINYG
jgi:hypothetical protein